MISKEKRKEYVQRYRKKYPEKYRERFQADNNKRKVKELTAKVKEQDAVIADLQQKLERVEHDAKRYSAKARYFQHLHDKAKEFLKFTFDENDHRVDAVLLVLDFIYKDEEKQ